MSVRARTRVPIDGGNNFIGIFPYDSQYMINFTDKWITRIVYGSILAVVPLLLIGQLEIARIIFQCTKYLSVWCLGSSLIEICLSIFCTCEQILSISSSTSLTNRSVSGSTSNSQVPPQNQNCTPSNLRSTLLQPTNAYSQICLTSLGTKNNNNIEADAPMKSTLDDPSSDGMRNLCRPSGTTPLNKKSKLIGFPTNSLKKDCIPTRDSDSVETDFILAANEIIPVAVTPPYSSIDTPTIEKSELFQVYM